MKKAKKPMQVKEQATEYRISEIDVTRKEFNLLVKEVRGLAHVQRQTEKQLGELTQVQKRTEVSVDKLSRGVDFLMSELAGLKIEVGGLGTEVGGLKTEVKGLSDRVGFSLEELGRELLPPYLKHHFGINVRCELKPKWFKLDNVDIELNFYCEF
ncbi:MAG: hypothetical protein QME68_05240 [Elusimicrobiota bacterium]|nr:hypothetical protein [Elusimicrobiota bacterium]